MVRTNTGARKFAVPWLVGALTSKEDAEGNRSPRCAGWPEVCKRKAYKYVGPRREWAPERSCTGDPPEAPSGSQRS